MYSEKENLCKLESLRGKMLKKINSNPKRLLDEDIIKISQELDKEILKQLKKSI
ncbi:Spo0E family sporulation regulatory protein-aspartic acid phosphatase [Halonatronum saccharophilum]|uniref:Spo0E family sporulation regulatory protein-aspartic acid phosphatase n=1 Tax=Halonatronum saccharophilum TaxID=150060 RepID=UPI0004BB3E39|nr:Spo0E family sporulation regulatory protein-aspartic acid phosphatase [Halonatronum saccharophilum]